MKDILTGIILTIIAIAVVSWLNPIEKKEQQTQISDKYSSEIEAKEDLKNADIVLTDKFYINTSLLSPHTGEG